MAAYFSAGFILLTALKWRSLSHVIAFILISAYYPPFQSALYYQNLHQIVLLLVVLSWIGYTYRRYTLCAVMIGIAALIKIWPVALLVALLLIGHKRASLIGAATILLGILISSIVFGHMIYLEYLNIPQVYIDSWVVNKGNISFVSFLAKILMHYNLPLHSAIQISAAVTIIFSLIILLTFWHKSKSYSKTKEYLLFCLLPTLICLFFPIMWEGGLIIMLLPYTIIFLRFREVLYQPAKYFILFIIGTVFSMDILQYVFVLQLYFFNMVPIPFIVPVVMSSSIMFFFIIQLIIFNKLKTAN